MAALAVPVSSTHPTQVGDGLRHSDNRLFRDRLCKRPQFGLFRVRIISNDSAGDLFGDRGRINERSGRPIPVPHTQHYCDAVEISPERFFDQQPPKKAGFLEQGKNGSLRENNGGPARI